MRNYWPLLEGLKEGLSAEDKASLLDGLCHYQINQGQMCEMTPAAKIAMAAIHRYITIERRGNPNFKKGETNPYYNTKDKSMDSHSEPQLPLANNTLPPSDGGLLPLVMVETQPPTEVPAPVKPARAKNPQTAHYRAFLEQIEDERMREVLTQWLVYKVERREYYKPMGLKSCFTSLKRMSGGDPAVAEQIVTYSAGNHYQGLVIPRDCGPQSAPQPQPASRAQENFESRAESARLINNLMNNGEL